jgi:hypothetical protein
MEAIEMPTDVVDVPAPHPVGPAFWGPGAGPALAAAVVAWGERGRQGPRGCCGVLTVGHAFRDRNRPLLRFEGTRSEHDFNGRLVVRSRRPSSVDAAVVQVHARDLVENNLLSAAMILHGMIDLDHTTERETVDLPRLAMITAARRTLWGAVWNGPSPSALRFHAYLPTMKCPPLGVLQHVISARASGNRPFRPGTSGALWDLQNVPAAVQVAAVPPDFRFGFAQALQASIAWARRAVEAREETIAGSFRVVGNTVKATRPSARADRQTTAAAPRV